ncbi:MAG: LysR family transcriptional regulator [Sandaracinus sp.]|nr:LysR family transcriptional regulator [Sandaracinus sp.]
MMSDHEPSWELYETFLEVMREGSLSGASRTLGVAQPTVRRRVESLESALDAVLFTRAQNGLVPTEAAHAMWPHAEAMAMTARALSRAVSAPHDAERGTVRVTASEVIGAEVLPPMLASLREAHPRIQIELALSNRTQDLLRRDADVAVRMVAPTQQALVAKRVGEIPMGFFATEGYVARRGVPKRLADLAEHELIGADRDRALLEGLAAMGLDLSPRAFALRTDHDLAYLAAIRAGLGIGACQAPLAARSPALVAVLPNVRFTLPVWVVMHEDLRGVRRVRAVFDHLVRALEGYVASAPKAKAKKRRA